MKFQAESIVYEFDNFRIDSGKRLLSNGGPEPIPLTPKIFDTLLYLVSHHSTLIDKDELMSAIWPDTIVEENNLNKNISVLRRVLGEHPGDSRYIVTVPGKGYRFVAPVTERSINAEVVSDGMVPRYDPLRANKVNEEERTNSSRLRYWLVAALGLVLFTAAFYIWRGASSPSTGRIRSIAVLPFKPMAAESSNEAMEFGIADSLITQLSKGDLVVKSFSGTRKYAGADVDAAEAGRSLDVDAVLDGSIQFADGRIRISTRLIRSADGKQIWADKFDDEMRDVFTVQDSITEKVAAAVNAKLNRGARKHYTENVEAYQLYLRGRFHIQKLTTPEIEKGVSYLQQAIDTDPFYALAYAEIAESYRALAMAGEMYPGDVLPKAKEAAQKAVELDDSLAEAHSNLGFTVFLYDWNWAEAEKHLKRALELDPNSSMVHFAYFNFLGGMGRREEALAEIKRAREIEPLSPFINAFEAVSLSGAGQKDAALDRVRIAIDLNPNFYFAHMIAAGIYSSKEMYPESIAEARRAKELSPNQTWSDVGLAGVLIKVGKIDDARAILNEMLRLSESRYVPPFNIAIVCNALGETDQALAFLEKGYQQRDPKMTFLKTDRRLNNLHEDPHFQDLMRRVGF